MTATLSWLYDDQVVETQGTGSDGAWCRCLLGMTLLVVNDGRCQTTPQ